VIDAGADDFYAENNFYLVSTSVDQLMVIRDRLDNAGYVIKSAEIEMVPKTNQILDDLEANKFLKLLDALEDNDDVNKVYTNFDFD
jgi:transcriptional/translational regulatory protein YebC/TACO1